MSAEPSPDQTVPHGLDEGIALALRAEDDGDWKPVAQWLACNPARAGEVAEFLSHQKEFQKAMGGPTAAPDRVGTGVGGLALKEKVGEGGMGVVYRAYDPKLNRDVAVKMVRAGGTLSPAELARFRVEAETVAALNHPNIVPVHSFGEADGAPYLVMPLMTGGSLALRLKNLGPDRRLPQPAAAELVREIARGAHHAHQRGLIHRDLKPANVLLDAGGVPHIADFGLACPIDLSWSTSGGIAGTAAYMAPEQARGEKGLTTAVDVHALGAILFELLTGRTPFGGADLPSVLRRVAEEPAPPVRALRSDVHRNLELICQKCLSKAPQDRYPSAAALADDLGRFLAGESVKAQSRGLFAEVAGALRWERVSPSFVTWQAFAYGAVNTAFNHAAIAALALAGYPRASFGLLMYHVFTWAAFLWWFAVRKRSQLTTLEQSALALHIGGVLAVVVTVPVALATRGPDIAGVYPFYNAVIGCLLFAHGTIHHGRHYLVGLIWLSQNLLLPLLPVWAWPALHAVVGGGIHVYVAVNLWQSDRAGRAAEAAHRTNPD